MNLSTAANSKFAWPYAWEGTSSWSQGSWLLNSRSDVHAHSRVPLPVRLRGMWSDQVQ
jgi:hypothetical protein